MGHTLVRPLPPLGSYVCLFIYILPYLIPQIIFCVCFALGTNPVLEQSEMLTKSEMNLLQSLLCSLPPDPSFQATRVHIECHDFVTQIQQPVVPTSFLSRDGHNLEGS